MANLQGSPDEAASKPWDEYSDSSNHTNSKKLGDPSPDSSTQQPKDEDTSDPSSRSDSKKLGDPSLDSSTQHPKDEDTSDPSNHSDSNKLGDPFLDSSTQQPEGNLLGNSSPSSSTQNLDEKSKKSTEWITKKSRKFKPRPSTSEPIKLGAIIDHSTTNWRDCSNNYCIVHLGAKQHNGYFPKPKDYNPSTTHPRANASPASSTPQPKVTQTTAVDHSSLSWTICYNDHCQAHLAAKKDWGWFPRKARYFGPQNNGQQNNERPNNDRQNMGRQNNDRLNNGRQDYDRPNNGRQNYSRQYNGQTFIGQKYNGQKKTAEQNIVHPSHSRRYNGQTFIGQKYNGQKNTAQQTPAPKTTAQQNPAPKTTAQQPPPAQPTKPKTLPTNAQNPKS